MPYMCLPVLLSQFFGPQDIRDWYAFQVFFSPIVCLCELDCCERCISGCDLAWICNTIVSYTNALEDFGNKKKINICIECPSELYKLVFQWLSTTFYPHIYHFKLACSRSRLRRNCLVVLSWCRFMMCFTQQVSTHPSPSRPFWLVGGLLSCVQKPHQQPCKFSNSLKISDSLRSDIFRLSVG